MHLDDRVTIATPEGVTLELIVAGLGSRFVARLLDLLIQGILIIALAVGVGFTAASGVVIAIATVLIFLIFFAYDIPFEVLNGGRTVGKMAAGIRVVGLDGEPVSFFASVLRNVVRIADLLPGTYIVGAISIVMTTRDQRLGDLAAGTIVVRDKFPGLPLHAPPPLTVPLAAVATWDVSAIDAQDLATIRRFLDRRLALPWPIRMHFANALASRVAPAVAGIPVNTHPEYLLEGVAVAKQARQ